MRVVSKHEGVYALIRHIRRANISLSASFTLHTTELLLIGADEKADSSHAPGHSPGGLQERGWC